MQKFWELLQESVIVQGVVTLGLTGVVIYMEVTGKEISGTLNNAFLLALGFYFGSKVTLASAQIARLLGGK